MSILDTIIAHKRLEVAEKKAARPLSDVVKAAGSCPTLRDFRAALVDPERSAPRVIAEIKRRSPSKGTLRPNLDHAQVARIYEQNGAAALSVLTDSRFFGGSLADLAEARANVLLPALCKEFVVDPYQIHEARAAGADAVLLIAAVLDSKQLRSFRHIAADLGMAALIEVHNERELGSALDSGAEIIGINNRDLRTFKVSLNATRALLPSIPASIVTVSESGVHTAADRAAMLDAGVDALLVGEGLLTAPDIAAATREICGFTQRVTV